MVVKKKGMFMTGNICGANERKAMLAIQQPATMKTNTATDRLSPFVCDDSVEATRILNNIKEN
jgi:hypothetical protein